MGLILNQSIKNTIITYFGFGIGAINTLFLFPFILGDVYYALTGYVTSASNIIMPILAFGMQNTLIKFYSQYQTEEEKNGFLSFTVFFPILFCIPLFCISLYFYEDLSIFISKKNKIVKSFILIIPFIGLFMGYFEIFYAWARVNMHSVFGNFIKEVGIRLFSLISLIFVYYKWVTIESFLYITGGIYLFSFVIMMCYAFYVKKPVFKIFIPKNVKNIIEYTFYIILSGTIANLLLDVDKLMLNQYLSIQNIAFYGVAAYIALVISVPGRAMHQIIYPITAKLMIDEDYIKLNSIYKKTSINLQVLGGIVMLCIFININELYELIPKEGYSSGKWVVFMIGISKYFELILGNNNAIVFNSKYYKTILFLGILLVFFIVSFNMYFIPRFGVVGAAFATLLSITLYSLAKLFFVIKKLNLYPFTRETIYSLIITVLLFLAFYFWEFPFFHIINIFLKSVLVIILYFFIHYKFIISSEINTIIENYLLKYSSRIIRKYCCQSKKHY
jgi:O-antigen/teichoic acid export membrane protein